jgi:hypothetical protein
LLPAQVAADCPPTFFIFYLFHLSRRRSTICGRHPYVGS